MNSWKWVLALAIAAMIAGGSAAVRAEDTPASGTATTEDGGKEKKAKKAEDDGKPDAPKPPEKD